MKSIRVIITGGRTGGHVFPGLALADQLKKIDTKTDILFVGFGRFFIKEIFNNAGYQCRALSLGKFVGRRSILKTLQLIVLSLIEIRCILKEFKPHLVISVGGNPAGLMGLMSRIKRISLVVCEQNILLGMSNRFLSVIADRTYISFKDTKGFQNTSKIMVTGNPLRKALLDTCKIKFARETSCDLDRKVNILIMGGSQGAHIINTIVIESLEYIKRIETLRFIHQTGLQDEKWVRKIYKIKKIESEVGSFFRNIGECYAIADIIICRAGATTLAEIMLFGKCSLIIPYPFAAGNHQMLNALYLAKNGAAKMIIQKQLNGFKLAQIIDEFIDHPMKVESIALKAKKLGVNNAAELIITDSYRILREKKCI